MKLPTACAPLRLLLPLLAVILSACATKPPQQLPLIPAPPAALMTDDLSESQDYSQRVRAWLKRAADELSDLRQRKPGCNVISPKSGACS